MSLRARLILAAAYLLTVAVITLEVPLALSIEKRATREFEAGILTNAVLVAARINDDVPKSGTDPTIPPTPPPAIAAIVEQAAQVTGARIIVTDALGRLIADSSNESPVGTPYATADRPELLAVTAVPGGQIDVRQRFSETLGETLLLVTAPVIHNRGAIGAVRISEPLASLHAKVRRSWVGFGLIGLIVILVGLVLAWFLATTLARPILRLEQAARRLGSGDLATRAEPEGPKEFAALGGSFNRMADALGANIAAQRDFLANASHQLRTPLTGIKLRLEAIEGEGGFSAEQARKAGLEVDRLSGLVDDLLALARASSAETAGARIDLADVAARAVDRWSGPATRDGKSVELTASAPVEVWASDEDLARVLDNLIENGIRYSPKGTRIRVEAVGSGRPMLAVDDDGPGIHQADRARLFERFYRGSTAKMVGPGTGLGLAVAAELVKRWGGDIRLVDDPDRSGARFEARFPQPPTIP